MKKIIFIAFFLFSAFVLSPPISLAQQQPVEEETGATKELRGDCKEKGTIDTGIGCIPFGNFTQATTFFFRWAVGIGGGITMLFIIYAGYIIITSSGDPKRLQHGQELLTSAIGGVLVIIFSIFLLRFIGVNILGIL